MTRTPDEIKKGLECCKPIWKNDHWKTCDRNCPYVAEAVNCRTMLNGDALAYISQLESQNRCFKEIKESCERRMIDMAQRMPSWISVEDRLPEHGAMVLCNTKYYIEVLQWHERDGLWVGMRTINTKGYVTHWMPLPEPPPEKGESE